MKLLAISVSSWAAGLIAHVAALRVFWGQGIGERDLEAIASWSAVASVFAIVVAHAPGMLCLRSRLRRAAAGRWAFPILGIVLGAVPLAFTVCVWSGAGNFARTLASPPSILFSFNFAAFGAVFGAGFFLAYGRAGQRHGARAR